MSIIQAFSQARVWRVAAAVLMLWGLSARASAQTLYGSIVGNVTDETGLAVPGATVKILHTETSQTRESLTNSTGGYNFPNIPTGTYQVDVTLTGFQAASSRDITVRQNTAVRVDVRLSVGTLQETVLVSGTAAVLQTESAAVQMQTTSEQLVNLPTSGRSYQSFIGLMPGVAQPYMIQAGGINNPARSMGVSVNGQPPNNTLFRIDGAAVTNQWYPDIQSYSPGLEAVETVSVVTNSFDADQGMAGGAAVNVQVKSGTNRVSGSLFEYLTGSALKNRPYFLPTGTDKGQDTKNIFGGTIGGPIVRNQLFYFVSVESEVRRVKDGTVQLAEGEVSTGTTGLNTLPPADLRRGDFSQTNTVLYDPQTGTPTGTGRVPFAFGNCPGLTSTADPRFASCNYIPDGRINSISRSLLADLVLPTAPGYQDNYYARDNYESTLHKIDTKLTWTPGNRLNLNNRLSWLTSRQNSHGIFPSLDGAEYNPLSVGRLWQANITSGSVLATSILSPTFVVDGVFGYTPYHSWVGPEGPEDECWGAHYAIPNACQPPRSRDRAAPQFNMGGWSLVTPSQMRDYADNQMQFSGNAGWTKGTHNVKFGFDVQRNYLNHYETQVPVFTFNGGATALSGGTSPNNFNQFADFLLGLPQSRNAQVMTPLLSTDGAKGEEWPATVRSWATGLYLRDQWQMTPKMTASIGVRWEYYPFPVRTDRGLEMFDFQSNLLQVCGIGAANPQVCDIKVQNDLFTPRLGWAYRPTDDTVIRVGFSRNPQSDNAVTRVGGIAQSFPQVIQITESGVNTFTPVGSLSAGVPLVPPLDLSSGCCTAARWRRRDDPRRGIRARHDHLLERHRAEALSSLVERAVGLRRQQAEQPDAPRQPQLWPDRRWSVESAVQPAWTGQRAAHDGRHERVQTRRQNHLRLAAVQRDAPHDPRVPVHVGIHLRACDRLVGREHHHSGVLPPEQGHAGGRLFPGGASRHEHAAQGRRIRDLSAALRTRAALPQFGRHDGGHCRRLAGELDVHGLLGSAVHRVVEHDVLECARQPPARRSGERRRRDSRRRRSDDPLLRCHGVQGRYGCPFRHEHVQQLARAWRTQFRPQPHAHADARRREDTTAESGRLQLVQPADVCESGKPERVEPAAERRWLSAEP